VVKVKNHEITLGSPDLHHLMWLYHKPKSLTKRLSPDILIQKCEHLFVWQRENDGLRLYANARDPQNDTKYYQWKYEETWEIHSSRFPP